MPQLILLSFLLLAAWLIKRDVAQRPGLSAGVWIPTIWLGILASRPVSSWIGGGGSGDSLDGSPVDRLFFSIMIVLAIRTLAKRKLNLSWLVGTNWAIFLF